MKIAILGDSHVSALKRAWDGMRQDHPDIEIVFFADRHKGLEDLRLEGQRLVPATETLKSALSFTSHGREDIDLAEFDAILVYALGANALFVDRYKVFTRKVLRQAAADRCIHSLNYRLVQLISGACDRPLYIGHAPLTAGRQKAGGYQGTEPYLDGIALVNEVIYAPLRARLLPQPLETIVNGYQTDHTYSRGSTRLAVGDRMDDVVHPDDDLGHMNPEFGALWMKNALAMLTDEAARAAAGNSA